MIALDPEHTTDPDFPVPFENSDLDAGAPIWCRWAWVQPENAEPYMEPVKPYGKTVADLRAGDADDIDALE